MDLTSISYIVPYRPDGGHRDRVWNWCRQRIEKEIPEMEILLGYDVGETPFCRAIACNRGVALSEREVVVIGDADVVITRDSLIESLQLLERYKWVTGYNWKRHLDEEYSKWLLEEPVDTEIPRDAPIDGPYQHITTGGTSSCLMIRRSDFNDIGGFDERFIGWNYEDQAFAAAAETLLGPMGRTDHYLFHIWHPYAKEVYEKPDYYFEGEELFHRYKAAFGNETLMRNL